MLDLCLVRLEYDKDLSISKKSEIYYMYTCIHVYTFLFTCIHLYRLKALISKMIKMRHFTVVRSVINVTIGH